MISARACILTCRRGILRAASAHHELRRRAGPELFCRYRTRRQPLLDQVVNSDPSLKRSDGAELSVGIATSGRFHLLDLARELDSLGVNVRFYSYVSKRRAKSFGLPGR